MQGNATTGGPSALEGIRVLEFASDAAGYAGRLLADLGADVILVEPPGGGPSRHLPPFTTDAAGGRASLHDVFVNAGKRAVTLDLERDDDRALLLDLVARADVCIEASPPGELDRLGLGFDRFKERNPELVLVSLTPFGQVGPHAGYQGGDLVSLATGGLLHLGGYLDAGPVAVHGRQSHFIGSVIAAVAALIGLLGRRRGTGPAHIDVSTQEGVTLALEDSLAGYELNGRVRGRLGGRAREAGTGTYPCADGYVTMVAGRLSTARSWRSLVEWLTEAGAEQAELLHAPEWDDFLHRGTPEAIETFERIFSAFAGTRTKTELYLEGQRRSIAIAPVNSIDDVSRDPQLVARGAFQPVEQPLLGRPATFPTPPYRLSETPARIRGAAPRVGEHDAEVRGEML